MPLNFVSHLFEGKFSYSCKGVPGDLFSPRFPSQSFIVKVLKLNRRMEQKCCISYNYSLTNWQLHWEYLRVQEVEDTFDDALGELAEYARMLV